MTDFTIPSDIPLTEEESFQLTGIRDESVDMVKEEEEIYTGMSDDESFFREKTVNEDILEDGCYEEKDRYVKYTWNPDGYPEEYIDKLNISEIKKLTGDDTISARDLEGLSPSEKKKYLLEKTAKNNETPEISSKKRVPLHLVFARDHTKEEVQKAILNAVKTLKEKDDEIEGCQICIKGFEHTSIHPALIKAAKKKYAEAIDFGLLGFLMLNGFEDTGRDIYLVAHCQGQRKKEGIRFKKINGAHMLETTKKSTKVFLDLIGNQN